MISNEQFGAIAHLDFTAIKFKLTHQTFGEGWSQTKADAIEKEYRRFLYLLLAFPGEQAAPTLDVDTFWHYHILDTMKYAADCAQAFGFFLHHYPYLGLLEGEDPETEVKAGNRTRELYEATFGEAYIRDEAYGHEQNGGAAARCQGPCTVAAPEAPGNATARCHGPCTAAAPQAKGAANARCQGPCTAAVPQAKGAATARCQGPCTASVPQAKGAATARCQGPCTASVPRAKGAVSARCQGPCTGAFDARNLVASNLTGMPVIPPKYRSKPALRANL